MHGAFLRYRFGQKDQELKSRLWAPVSILDSKTFPAGIIGSAEAQVKLNMNEWVCTDMNVC